MLLNLFEPYLLLSNSFLNYRGLPELRGSDSRGNRKFFEKKWKISTCHSYTRAASFSNLPHTQEGARAVGKKSCNSGEFFILGCTRPTPRYTCHWSSSCSILLLIYRAEENHTAKNVCFFHAAPESCANEAWARISTGKATNCLLFLCVCAWVCGGGGWFWHIIQPKNI